MSNGLFYTHSNGDISLFPSTCDFDRVLFHYLDFIQETSPHYRASIQSANFTVHSDPFEIFDSLPYTTKETYREILKMEALREIGNTPFVTDFSSGSVAEPVIRICKSNDDLCEQDITETTFKRLDMGPDDCFVCVDVGAADIYDFYYRAARNLGVKAAHFLHLTSDMEASILPLLDLRPTILLTLPSLLVRTWPYIERFWQPAQSPIKTVIAMGEFIDPAFRIHVERQLACKVFSFYGTTEIGGLGGECKYQDGHHFDPRYVVPTIKSPTHINTEEIEGEVAYTTLHIHTQSVIKYEVGDVVKLSLIPCACGDATPRLWFRKRTTEDFILAGDKFSYDMFLNAFREEVPDITIMSLEINEPTTENSPTILSFKLPESFKGYELKLLDILKNGIFELDALFQYGLVDFYISFKPVTKFEGRKVRRVKDLRAKALA